MSTVLLVNIDSKLPNIALKKIEMWHKAQGDEVIWDMPILLGRIDKSYASCIFTKNRHIVADYKGLCPDLIAGGSGWDLETTLPPEMDEMKPRINYGFTTRGCIRKCKFCVVPQKEGYIKVVGDLMDIWDGKARSVILLDNNILALPDHFALICEQAKKHNIKLDFNQGLDHRLLTPEIVKLMKSISHTEYRFAYDHPSYSKTVKRAIKMLKENGINRANWYVLVGFDTTPDEDLARLNYLRDEGQRAYVQRYETHYHDPFYIGLARWVNQPNLFVTMTWQEFLDYPRADHRKLKQMIRDNSAVKVRV